MTDHHITAAPLVKNSKLGYNSRVVIVTVAIIKGKRERNAYY